MKCKNCSKDIPDDAAFCPYCVTKIKKNDSIFCGSCGAELHEGVKFCHKCAAPIKPAEKSSKPKSSFKNMLNNKKAKIIVFIGVIAIAFFAGYMIFFAKPDYLKYRNCVSGDENGIIAVKKDGTVVAVPALFSLDEIKQYKGYAVKDLVLSKKFTIQEAVILTSNRWYVQDYRDIIQLASSIGLKSDGTIISNSDYINDITADINDIKYISYNTSLLAMIHENGTAEIMFTYDIEGTTNWWDSISHVRWKIDRDQFFINVAKWADLKQIEVYTNSPLGAVNDDNIFQAVALKNDGTVVAYGVDYDVSKLSNIKSISVVFFGDGGYLVALKNDGTVVVVGEVDFINAIDVSDWKNIVAISASDYSLAGLKSNGTVVISGSGADVSDWKNIVSIYSGGLYGLTKNGQVMYSGLQEGETITEHFPDFAKLTNIGPMK